MRLHRCPECATESLATPEQWGAIHLECPACQIGSVFRDARGGYECSQCDQRFLIHWDSPDGYGGPGGPLRWWEKPLTGKRVVLILCSLVLCAWLYRQAFSTLVLCLFFWRYWYDEHHRGTPPRNR